MDTLVPTTIAQMQELQARLRDALARGRGIYVHCRAGIGRTGVVVGCYLAETGLDGKAALTQLNLLWRESARSKTWPQVPQTPEQADYIRRWPQYRACEKAGGEGLAAGRRSGVIARIVGMGQWVRSASRRKV